MREQNIRGQIVFVKLLRLEHFELIVVCKKILDIQKCYVLCFVCIFYVSMTAIPPVYPFAFSNISHVVEHNQSLHPHV